MASDITKQADSTNESRSRQQSTSSSLAVFRGRISPLESLGVSGCVVVVGGSVVVFAIMSVLIFLWVGIGPSPRGEKALLGWRIVMLNGWATRSVTISSLILRSTTAFQTGICTSMIAAIFFERGHIRMSQAAHLSLARGMSGSASAFLSRITFRRSRFRTKGVRLEWALLVTLAATSIAIQFSSTILLSCFGTTSLVEHPVSQAVTIGVSTERAALLRGINNGDSGSSEHGGTADNTFAVFGRLQSNVVAMEQQAGLSDTGLKRHAFLPFNQGNRSNILGFQGPSLVTNTRVSCLRPTISARLGTTEYDAYAIYGNISYRETFDAVGQIPPEVCEDASNNTTSCLPSSFVCAWVTANTGLSRNRGVTFACPLQTNATFDNSWNIQESPLAAESQSWPFLLFSTNAQDDDIPDDKTVTLPLVSSTPYDEWSSYSIHQGVFYNMTLCFIGYNTEILLVDMTRSTDDYTEPTVENTVFGNSTGLEDIELMFETFNEGDASYSRAGLLTISTIEETVFNEQISSDTVDLMYSLGLQSLFNSAQADNASIFLCVECAGLGWNIPTDLEQLFNDMINAGTHASVAFEIFLTIYTQRIYYFAQSGFDVFDNVTVTFSSNYEIPQSWMGLGAVLGLIMIQLFSVWLTTLLFVMKARFTRQGNVWHTVSQLLSPDGCLILSQSHEARDRDVSIMLAHYDPAVTLTRSEHTGLAGLTIVR
ncbi:hypothetical protein F5Y16DRAFT_256271 [Xylariaceae sp. FL0255]|nr:hypothetical protein F5Y16DRAFT_256271 [Xylariaceae sp. FL0255]